MRLDKFLAECGLGTRTEVKKLIKSGSVTVECEEKIKPETHIIPEECRVFVNGKLLNYRKFIYLLLNKPKGYVSATWDKKLPTVIDLLSEKYRHFNPFPVGRLDIDTTGLLILTNDGDLSHNLLSPKHHVPKTYIAELENPPKLSYIEVFEKGIDLGDFVTLPASLKFLSFEKPYLAEVTICEGKFHQVKRMFEAVSNKVVDLKRIKFKNIELDENLALGDIRELLPEEVKDLKEI
ncbi:MAG: pseudouridine synthase [Clostridia bacterium]|nr:pseudouridine synthase [Clostridia bacterium]